MVLLTLEKDKNNMADDFTLQSNIEKQLGQLPPYIKEWYRTKMIAGRSKRTLYEYLNEYRRFFTWLLDADIVPVKDIKDIPLSALENLSKADAECFFIFLRERNLLNTNKPTNKSVSEVTIHRTYRALSGLFKYLTEQTENENGEPYFYRNVMKKLEIKTKKTETLSAKANKIAPKLFLGDLAKQFLHFIMDDTSAEGYVKKANLSNRALSTYYRDRERDVAIIALIIGTGIRLSEAVNTDLKDLNLQTLSVEVTRKGGKKDYVNIAPYVIPYIEPFLEIRASRYKIDGKDANLPLFLSVQTGVPMRLKGAGIERLVGKYSKAFGTEITPHMLRHALATDLYKKTGQEGIVAQQLGHASTALVSHYAHIADSQVKDGLSML